MAGRGRKLLRGIFQNLRHIFPETENRRAAALFAALPARRGATGENDSNCSCSIRAEQGGLGLTDEQVGLVYGTVGIIALMLGGLLGGFVVARHGLKFWLWPMLLAIHLPDAVFVWLAYAQPENFSAIGAGVAIEQFGYGFGFTAFMLYMIYIARGEHQTAHYAICTGFMALGMMLPGMWSGWLQEHLGYPHFFVWVLLATIPSFIVALRIPLEAEFGKRETEHGNRGNQSGLNQASPKRIALNAPVFPESKFTMKSICFHRFGRMLAGALLAVATALDFCPPPARNPFSPTPRPGRCRAGRASF